MVSEAQRLHAALVSALPAYVMAALTERGYPLNRSTAEAIEEATEFLDRELAVELEKAYRDQRRSPLELFRAALGIVALTLTDAGVSRMSTAPPTVESDTYGLAPGSSSALGPEAHAAHVAWGVAKAAAFVGGLPATPAKPVILLLAADRDDRDAIAPLLESPGVACIAVRNPAAVVDTIESGSVLVAVVDLAHRSSRDAITRLIRAGIATIVYGAAIDDLTETGLRAQGVRSLIDRQAFVADPTRFIPPII